MEDEKFYKLLSAEMQNVGEREILAIASTDAIDRSKDTLNQENWILTDFLKNPVFLYAHNYHEDMPPIGVIRSIQATGGKLWVKIYFPRIEELTSYFDIPELIHEHAKFIDFIYNSYRSGLMKALSVGFRGKWKFRNEQNWDDGKIFSEQYLIEISGVPIGDNQDALAVPKEYKKFLTGGSGMEIKRGARFSRETREEINAIYKELGEHHAEITKRCKAMDECHKKLAAMCTQEEPENDNGNDEGQEGGKSLDLLDILLKSVKE